MGTTVIANNCIAGSILHDLNMRFDTPTINLLIPPRQFPKFCKNLKHYMEYDVVEYTNFSDEYRQDIINIFGNIPPYFPYGLCDDILIVFQHYASFKDGKDAWNRRRARIDYEHIGYIFYLAEEKYSEAAWEFQNLGLNPSVIITEGFNIDIPHYNCFLPEDKIFLDTAPNGKKYYAQEFNPKEFITEVNK